jgi:hypothetical protein
MSAIVERLRAKELGRPNEWQLRNPDGPEAADTIEALLVALEGMIYEATHLSPCKPNGDHDCTITAGTLAKARLVRSQARS